MTNSVLTLGCRLNFAESEEIKNLLEQGGYHDTVVINTCAVTNEAVRKSRQLIRKTKKTNPNANIIVTGCASDLSVQEFEAMSEVEQVIRNDKKLDFNQYKKNNITVEKVKNTKTTVHSLINRPQFVNRARTFVQIQNGCNHNCTFCIIPFARGTSTSLEVETILQKIQMLCDQGHQEVVLTGVDITDYGKDLNKSCSLGNLVKSILHRVKNLPRLRLSSLDCPEVDKDIIDLIKNDNRFMPHLHLSLQSGDDMILKRMKRRHLRAETIDLCKFLKSLRPEFAIGADFIVGFPTETEDMFDNTIDIIEQCKINYCHIFPYSARSGTPAARMPQVESQIIKSRTKKLQNIAKMAKHNFMEQHIGKKFQVLIETCNKNISCGKTETYAPVQIDQQLKPGSVIPLLIKESTDNHMVGIPVR